MSAHLNRLKSFLLEQTGRSNASASVVLQDCVERSGGLWGRAIFESCDETVRLAGACQLEAAQQNLEYAVRLLAPLWRYMPLDFTQCTHKTTAWRLLMQNPHELRADSIREHTLGAHDCLADFLHLHLLVHEYAETIAGQYNLSLQPTRAHSGGLRTAAFLRCHAELLARAEGDTRERTAFDRRLRSQPAGSKYARALKSLQRLVVANPLSQLVYLDIAAHHYAREGVEALPAFPPDDIHPVICPAHDWEQARKLGRCRATTEPRGWCNLWVSHVARALLGAMLSPPCEDAWANEERLIRLKLLGSLFNDHQANHLQARFLDMFIRHLSIAARDGLEALDMRRRPPAVRVRDALISESSPVFVAFSHILVGQSFERFGRWLVNPTQEDSGLADDCFAKFDNPVLQARRTSMRAQLIPDLSAILEPRLSCLDQQERADSECKCLYPHEERQLAARLRDTGLETPGLGAPLSPLKLLRIWTPRVLNAMEQVLTPASVTTE